MSENQFFIGYETLKNWQKSTVGKIVYVMPIETVQAGQMIETSELAVMVSQIDGPLVHYVKFVLANLSYAHGEYLGNSQDEKRRRAKPEQACEVITAWLAEQGYTVIRASIAIPADLRLIDGWADFLAYDKSSNRFFHKQLVVLDE